MIQIKPNYDELRQVVAFCLCTWGWGCGTLVLACLLSVEWNCMRADAATQGPSRSMVYTFSPTITAAGMKHKWCFVRLWASCVREQVLVTKPCNYLVTICIFFIYFSPLYTALMWLFWSGWRQRGVGRGRGGEAERKESADFTVSLFSLQIRSHQTPRTAFGLARFGEKSRRDGSTVPLTLVPRLIYTGRLVGYQVAQNQCHTSPIHKLALFVMAVASGGARGARGAVAPPVKKPPLKNNRNQNTYLNILGILGMESYDFR